MAGYWPSSFFACLWTETLTSRLVNNPYMHACTGQQIPCIDSCQLTNTWIFNTKVPMLMVLLSYHIGLGVLTYIWTVAWQPNFFRLLTSLERIRRIQSGLNVSQCANIVCILLSNQQPSFYIDSGHFVWQTDCIKSKCELLQTKAVQSWIKQQL